MLTAVGPDSTAEEVANTTGIPLYRVRSSLRELLSAGFISEQGGHFKQTAQGVEKVKSDD
jgi:predicted transcriptional regulator